MEKSFLEIRPEGLHVSAVKRSESGEGWVVRIFNPFNETQTGALRLNGGYSGPMEFQSPVERVESEFTLPIGQGKQWQRVRLVTLEEIPERNLTTDEDGWVAFEIGKKKILTLEFLPRGFNSLKSRATGN